MECNLCDPTKPCLLSPALSIAPQFFLPLLWLLCQYRLRAAVSYAVRSQLLFCVTTDKSSKAEQDTHTVYLFFDSKKSTCCMLHKFRTGLLTHHPNATPLLLPNKKKIKQQTSNPSTWTLPPYNLNFTSLPIPTVTTKEGIVNWLEWDECWENKIKKTKTKNYRESWTTMTIVRWCHFWLSWRWAGKMAGRQGWLWGSGLFFLLLCILSLHLVIRGPQLRK